MSKLLVINASSTPCEKSYTKGLTDLFLKYYQELNPHDEVIYLNLNNEKMAGITLTTANAVTYWNQEDAHKYIQQLKDVDKVVVTSPMNNFNISGLMKNYLDHVLLANETFSYKYSKKGEAIGLLPHLKVQIITTQGAPFGWYTWGNHTENLKGTWEFVGAKVNTPILLAGTKLPPLNQMSPSEAALTLEEQIKKGAREF
ncbi:FMN-dependent NADH-azoreductase [Williamsoniiplasma luminosum]|uniref:FMN dependent NADH:quinone oxidoreductase n=1 Tax=Williamsoniiplasma luminosum TaxID=214888 RepID=A0A2K8NXE9_9MOLU|nr:FMN-dependent NADH-azoreductase [Williamsoniiplasma luminosum]ATZ17313.1 FMN-dependent NADH-azoreductase [Williamsoniiplasma luminosum]